MEGTPAMLAIPDLRSGSLCTRIHNIGPEWWMARIEPPTEKIEMNMIFNTKLDGKDEAGKAFLI